MPARYRVGRPASSRLRPWTAQREVKAPRPCGHRWGSPRGSRRKLVSWDRNLAKVLVDELVQRPVPRGQVRLSKPSVIERWLQDGDEVEVIGTIEQRPDFRRESLPREGHTRPVLVSTPAQPLTVQLLRAR